MFDTRILVRPGNYTNTNWAARVFETVRIVTVRVIVDLGINAIHHSSEDKPLTLV